MMRRYGAVAAFHDAFRHITSITLPPAFSMPPLPLFAARLFAERASALADGS
jgi:hypothetical protein